MADKVRGKKPPGGKKSTDYDMTVPAKDGGVLKTRNISEANSAWDAERGRLLSLGLITRPKPNGSFYRLAS